MIWVNICSHFLDALPTTQRIVSSSVISVKDIMDHVLKFQTGQSQKLEIYYHYLL